MPKHPLTTITTWVFTALLSVSFTACAPTRPVSIPTEYQGPPPSAAAQSKPKTQRSPSSQAAPSSQQFVLKQPPAIKETEVPATGGEARPAPVERKPAQPQRLASMHLVNQANTALTQGKTDSAISLFEQAVQVDVYNGDAFYGLARAWHRKGSREKAIEFARKAEILFQDERAKLKEVYLFEANIFKEMGDKVKEEMYRSKASRLN